MSTIPNDVISWSKLVGTVGAIPQFLTLTSLSQTKCAPNLLVVSVAGRVVPGDGGYGSFWRRTVGQPTYGAACWIRSLDRYLPDGTESDSMGGYWIYSPLDDIFSIGQLGAVGDGEGSNGLLNKAACETAYLMADAITGTILVPRGHFMVDTPDHNVVEVIFAPRFGVSIKGCGNKGISVLETMPGANMHMISMGGYEQVEISGLTLEHNGSDPAFTAGTHIIRIGDAGFQRLTIRDCDLLNARTYGIGLQGDGTGGENSFIDINNLYIYRSGRDGIDIKDRVGENKAIYISETTVEEPGYRHTPTSDQSTAGIDIRGICCVSDCQVLGVRAGFGNGTTGIRVRSSNPDNPSVKGGQRSQITNCYIQGIEGVDEGRSVGVGIGDAYINVSNITVERCWRGYEFAGKYITGTNLQAHQFTERGIVVFPNTFDGTNISDNVKLSNVTLKSDVASNEGVLIGQGARNISLINFTTDVPNVGVWLQGDSQGTIAAPAKFTAATPVQNDTSFGEWSLPWDAASVPFGQETIGAAGSMNLNKRFGEVIRVTGSPSDCNQIFLAVGRTRILVFDVAVRFNDSQVGATSPIKLPGGTTTTTGVNAPVTSKQFIAGAGDEMTFLGCVDNSGNPYVQCVSFTRAAPNIIQYASSSLTTLLSSTAADIGSITLDQPGTYEISGQINFQGGSSPVVTRLIGWMNTSPLSVPNPVSPGRPVVQPVIGSVTLGALNYSYAVPTGVIEVGLTPVTVYLGAWATWTGVGASVGANGFMSARRIR